MTHFWQIWYSEADDVEDMSGPILEATVREHFDRRRADELLKGPGRESQTFFFAWVKR
ncbi:MAG: hypothetical protein OXU33_09360 [Gemmatimonadota bacterium]|nr:hypothetical protein [Gemmatimonadota bacterium]MDE3006683.1 hypothetical protein [Gemmatimonadota bacterium]MDE3014264.1 hypothetical protein [Gemmatimonadota bacterium]